MEKNFKFDGAVNAIKKRVGFHSFRQADPVTLVFANLEYVKAAFTIFSIFTLHVLFFCLHLNSALWPLIDFSFLANITFSFGLVLALALFIIRATPFLCTSIVLLGTAMYFGGLTNIRKLRSSSRYSQPSYVPANLAKVLSIGGRSKILLNVLSFAAPVPSSAAMKLVLFWQDRFLSRYLGLVTVFGYCLAIAALCYLYTGFWLLAFLFLALYALALFCLASRYRNEIAAILADLLTKPVTPHGSAEILARHDEEVTRTILMALIVVFGGLSAVSGSLRFNYLFEAAPVVIDGNGAKMDAMVQLASSSKGVFLTDGSEQFFLPYDSIRFIKTED